MEEDFIWFLDNHASIVTTYLNRVIVIKNKKIIADYDNEMAAILKTMEKHELGTFGTYRVFSNRDAYTIDFSHKLNFKAK